MVYLAGDNNLTRLSYRPQRNENRFDLNAERCRTPDLTRRQPPNPPLFRGKAGNLESDVVDNLGETNTGDPKCSDGFHRLVSQELSSRSLHARHLEPCGGWDDTRCVSPGTQSRVAGANVTRRGASLIHPASDAGSN